MQQGKVRYVGASNYRAWELMKALGISQRLRVGSFVSHQCSYSLADRTAEREMVPLLRDQGLGLMAYFPLGSGLLTGKYRPGEPAPPGSAGHSHIRSPACWPWLPRWRRKSMHVRPRWRWLGFGIMPKWPRPLPEPASWGNCRKTWAPSRSHCPMTRGDA